MKVQIQVAAPYADFSNLPKVFAKPLEVGDIVEYPNDYAKTLINAGLADLYDEETPESVSKPSKPVDVGKQAQVVDKEAEGGSEGFLEAVEGDGQASTIIGDLWAGDLRWPTDFTSLKLEPDQWALLLEQELAGKERVRVLAFLKDKVAE